MNLMLVRRRVLAVMVATLPTCVGISGASAQPVEQVRASVEAAANDYFTALQERDVETMNGYYLNSPEFEVIANGARIDYERWTASQRTAYPRYLEIRGGFSHLNVSVLGPNAALMTGVRDQTYIERSGAGTRFRGAATWVWTKQDGSWKIRHIHTYFTREEGTEE